MAVVVAVVVTVVVAVLCDCADGTLRGCIMIVQNKVVDVRFEERGSGDVVLLGPVGLVNDASWIMQASFTGVGASHVPANDTSGQSVTASLRKLISGAAVMFSAGNVPLSGLVGGALCSSSKRLSVGWLRGSLAGGGPWMAREEWQGGGGGPGGGRDSERSCLTVRVEPWRDCIIVSRCVGVHCT